jgi:hydrogenase-4 membrane subunit HyfE
MPSNLKLSIIYFKLVVTQSWSSKNYIFYHITCILKENDYFYLKSAVFLRKKLLNRFFLKKKKTKNQKLAWLGVEPRILKCKGEISRPQLH